MMLGSGLMEVKIIKGTNQIGGCITEISSSTTKIIIDFGKDLEEESDFDLEGLTYGKSIYDAVFITHSHGDHIGLINKINSDIPIYIDESSLKIYNIMCDFCYEDKILREVNIFNFNDSIKVGNIKVIPYRVDHSSYNSCMYLIQCEGKKILHTGDFRLHGRKEEETILNLKKVGKVDLLITEGTALNRNVLNYKKEKDLEKEVSKYMMNYNQVFIMQSSTNIDRTVSFVKSALNNKNNFILDLFTYSLSKIIYMNIKVDFKRIFVWKPLRYNKKDDSFKSNYMNFDASSYFGKNYVMQVKVSMLSDIMKLYEKGLITNACFIYSMWDGYIAKEERLRNFINKIESLGIKVINLHTSGHSDINSMKKLNEIINPDKTIIIHTEDNSLGKDIFNNVIDLKDEEIIKI